MDLDDSTFDEMICLANMLHVDTMRLCDCGAEAVSDALRIRNMNPNNKMLLLE